MPIPIFAHIAAGSYLIPTITGMRFWRFLNSPMKLFAVFCVYSIFHLIVEFTLGRLGISNQFLSNYYQLGEFICILIVYTTWIADTRIKDLFQYFGLIYCLIWMINKFYFESPDRFSELISTTSLAFLIIASVIILNSLIRTSQNSIKQYSIFWIAVGVLLYSAGTIIVASYSNEILAMGIQYFNILWHINWGFTIAANVLYARSFTCKTF